MKAYLVKIDGMHYIVLADGFQEALQRTRDWLRNEEGYDPLDNEVDLIESLEHLDVEAVIQ